MRIFRQIDSLRFFLAAAEHKGIRRAASFLSITQPALTRRIQLLEEELGTRLMDRSEKGVALSPAGEILARAAKQIELVCQQARAEIMESTAGELSELRIGAGPAWSYDIVPRAIGELRSLHPHLTTHIVSGRVDRLLDQLKAGELDVLVCTLPSNEEASGDYSYTFLCEISLAIFASASHPLANEARIGPKELCKFPWIWMEGTGVGRQHVASYFNRAGAVLPQASVTTNSFQSGLTLLETGTYLMSLPSTLTRVVSTRNLRPLSLDGSIWTYPAGIICRTEVGQLRTVALLTDCLKQALLSVV
ncbi:LysR substrate-binding domain-containing protein [Telluria sp. Tellsp104]